jgi:hypothetical protein
MDWCTLIEIVVVAYIAIQILRLIFADCDLQLQWAEKFGRSTGEKMMHGKSQPLRQNATFIHPSTFDYCKFIYQFSYSLGNYNTLYYG